MRLSLIVLLAGTSLVTAWTELHHEPFMNKNIDAIVVPGTYTSHMHTFFGSDAITNVLPTSTELQQGCYSGDNPNDLSVYWIPTLYYVADSTLVEVPIFRFSTYYTNSYSTLAIPQDLALISGNASAKTQSEADHPSNDLEWFCEGSDERESDIAKMPTSTCTQHLQVNLRFPNCVNSDNLAEYDFADESNTCPTGMQQIPQLRYRVLYDTNSVVPEGWSGAAPFQLSCSDTPGDGYCFHGDFINGWYKDAAENMLVAGGGGYDDGQFIAGEHGDVAVKASCTPTDADPENGTSDYYTSLETMEDNSTDVSGTTVEGETGDEVPAQTETTFATPAPTAPNESASASATLTGSGVLSRTFLTSLTGSSASRPTSGVSGTSGDLNRGKKDLSSERGIGRKSKRAAAKRADDTVAQCA